MTEHLRLDAQHPWPGLAAFGEDDQAYFHGRERESDELVRLVRRERLTVLFGRSGLGKSSLLSAGLFPLLRKDLHLPVYLRIGYAAAASPRQQVWEALAAACATGGVRAMPPEPDESLWAYFHRAGAGFWNPRRRPLLPVLVFDQFEEIFTLGQVGEAQRAASQAFIEELADLIEDRPSEALQRQIDADPARGEHIDFARRGCKVLLSFREDFLAEVEGLRSRMPSLMRNRFRLLPMDGAQALDVIGSALVGAEVADRIVGLAWRNRAEAPAPEEAAQVEIDPALLSVICSELNLRRLASGAPTIEADLLAGAEREILVDFYERSLQGLDPAVRLFVEDELITSAGYRDSCAFDDALACPGVTSQALEGLVDGRLLGLDERFGVRRLELTHDVLTRVVMNSRDQRREREAREQAEREREQAKREAQETERRLRRSRRITIAMTATALVASVLLGLIVDAYHWAKDNELPPDSMWTLQYFRLGYKPVPEMEPIPADTFDMGESDENFINKLRREKIDERMFGYPHKPGVKIKAGFDMGRYEISYDEFDYYVWKKKGLKFPPSARSGRGTHPVVNVSWREAMAYAEWLGTQPTYQNCSLPTEAQWEYAARSGSKSPYWWGAKFDKTKANCCNKKDVVESIGREERSKTFPSNDFKLIHMLGNVMEWTCSKWSDQYEGAKEWKECATDSEGERVLRGGAFNSDEDQVRLTRRVPLASDGNANNMGFRVICSSSDSQPSAGVTDN